MRPDSPDRLEGAGRRTALLTLFFLSGVSGLIYQIAWVRQSVFTFGVSVYAYSTVIGAYMIGLALGSYVMGRRVDAHARPLRTYAGLEVGIAALAALSPFLLAALHGVYPGLSNALPAGGVWLTLGRLVFSLAVLTPTTFLIGATLPVMSRIYATHGGRVGSDVGRLYLVNTAGAALGCVLTGLVFLRYLGARETIFLGAAINLLVAGGALALLRLAQAPRTTSAASEAGDVATDSAAAAVASAMPEAATPPAENALPIPAGALRYVAIAYGISGFIALGYEVVWARILYIHSSHASYSFSLMLTVFLAGLALGGAGASWVLRRRRATLRHFGAIQLAIGLLAVLILHAFARLPALHLEDWFGGYTIAYEFLIAFVTIFPPAVLLGALFPVVGSLYTRERAQVVGLRIGRVNAFNTLGAIAGSLGAGFVLVPLLGLRNTAVALAVLNLALGAVALRFDRSGGRRSLRFAPAGAVAATILAVAILPTGFYLGSYYTEADRLIFYKEGVETTVAVLEVPEDNFKISFVNGRDEVPTDRASMSAFRLLGHLPPLLRPGARNALVLSFGNGIATGTMNTHGIPVIDAVDLSPEMIEAAAVYHEENYDVLDSDRLRLHVEDGRNFLLRAEEPYDIISVDATHPANASSWALFTSEFYQLIESRLAEDGVFMQWIPIHGVREDDYRDILRTVWDVFPNMVLWSTGSTHSYVVATREPMSSVVMQSVLARAAANPIVARDLGPPETIAGYVAMAGTDLTGYIGRGPVITDNDAFFMPAR
ncbi:fused MFS/spermidine synthase [Candidatus Palauibacter sp.]|uniref:fused MFS/spermidine synthase n=1 Tax=Candidatus Palauibacter sp. TaxID=3101350 RepID=UPI003B529DE7